VRDPFRTAQRYLLASLGLVALGLVGWFGTHSAAQAPQYDLLIVTETVVLNKAEHTGAKPGRVLYGRGKT